MRHRVVLLAAALSLGVSGSALGAEEAAKVEEKILEEKCNLCHSSKRIDVIDPAQIAAVVERMRKMNPEWFVDIKSDHLVEAIAAIVKDPAMVAARGAWQDAVHRGGGLFASPALGKSGSSCKSCHDPAARPPEIPIRLRNVADGYPRWDPKLKRFVDLTETINRMIAEKLEGEGLPTNDQRLFDLVAYLKTLR